LGKTHQLGGDSSKKTQLVKSENLRKRDQSTASKETRGGSLYKRCYTKRLRAPRMEQGGGAKKKTGVARWPRRFSGVMASSKNSRYGTREAKRKTKISSRSGSTAKRIPYLILKSCGSRVRSVRGGLDAICQRRPEGR